MKRIARLAAIALLAGICGCSLRQETRTPRSATEQLLLSHAVERGTDLMDFHAYDGKKAWLDYSCLAPQTDKAAVQGMTERRLAECGVYVVREPEKADVIIQLFCPVLATDQQKLLIGTPQIPLPVPFLYSTTVQVIIPEIALFRKLSRYGFAEFSVNVLNAADRSPIEVQKKILTRTDCRDWTLLFVSWRSGNIGIRESVPGGKMQTDLWTL